MAAPASWKNAWRCSSRVRLSCPTMSSCRKASVAKAFQEFDADGRMKPSSFYDRVVDVCEELVKFTWLTRDASDYLTDRYSERKEEAEKLEQRVSLKSL